jgi:hypothetical protein
VATLKQGIDFIENFFFLGDWAKSTSVLPRQPFCAKVKIFPREWTTNSSQVHHEPQTTLIFAYIGTHLMLESEILITNLRICKAKLG